MYFIRFLREEEADRHRVLAHQLAKIGDCVPSLGDISATSSVQYGISNCMIVTITSLLNCRSFSLPVWEKILNFFRYATVNVQN